MKQPELPDSRARGERGRRRITALDGGILLLASLLVFVGARSLLRPTPLTVPHVSIPTKGFGSTGTVVEPLSRNGVRVYGGASLLLGASLGAIVVLGKFSQEGGGTARKHRPEARFRV